MPPTADLTLCFTRQLAPVVTGEGGPSATVDPYARPPPAPRRRPPVLHFLLLYLRPITPGECVSVWGAPAIPEETEALLRHDTDAYAAAEPVLDSVVKVFTVSSSPDYFLMVHSR
ncbi:uncharacterized protein [Miscanthus floridulus]|uniref:uncharacterized protein n=1 Tax=Miscanthus floridulus TaxID=154761 RepID=UPI00345AD15E